MQFLIPRLESDFENRKYIPESMLFNFPNIFSILSQHIHTSTFCYDFTVQSVLVSQHNVIQRPLNLFERKRLEFYDLGYKIRCILVLHRVFPDITLC